MKNTLEAKEWLREAEGYLEAAKRNMPFGDHRAVVQNAQLCIEFSAKAIIACFSEPAWTHNPGRQLDRLLEKHGGEIEEAMRARLRQLIQDVADAAPWHGLSVYGKRTPQGWTPASRLCTPQVAEDLLGKAERSLKTARDFIGGELLLIELGESERDDESASP